MSLILTGNFMPLKSSLFAKLLSVFVIFLGSQSGQTPFKTFNRKHLIKPFFGWFNSFGNLKKLSPAKGLYFAILIV